MNVQPRAYLKVLRMGRGTGEQGSWMMDRPSSLWLAFPANFCQLQTRSYACLHSRSWQSIYPLMPHPLDDHAVGSADLAAWPYV